MQPRIPDISSLQEKANELRIKTLDLLRDAPSGHIGGALGMADIFTAIYYSFADVGPDRVQDPDRDYILLSNGHICPIWYSVLGDLEYFSADELDHLRELGYLLQGHPVLGIPGVENSSGPLGHGLSQAIGIALGNQMDGRTNRVICLGSDGEQQEGQVWEAVMSAPKWHLDNLTYIIDQNGIQIE